MKKKGHTRVSISEKNFFVNKFHQRDSFTKDGEKE